MTTRKKYSPDPGGIKFGVFWLAPGVSRANAMTLFLGGLSTVALLAYMNFLQPFILGDVLQVPQERQGALTGLLTSIHETIVILLVGFLGALSDNTGRRIVFIVGMLIMAVGYVLYPTAGVEAEIFVFRMIFAVGAGAAAVMMHICYAEYAQDVTRGKWLGLVGICNGFGVVFMAFALAKLPAWYVGLGYSEAEAVRNSMWTAAAYMLVLAGLLRLGLQGRTAANKQSRENFFKQAGRGFLVARSNPRIALAYAMAFASRGDLAILTVFFSLWVVQTGHDLGIDSATSTSRAGMLFGLAMGMGLLWAYVMGVILDRLDRLTAMGIAFGLASVGYFALGQVADPFASTVILACVIVGIGESSAVVASGVLIGQEAPADLRGAVLGAFSVAGAVGMVILTFVGGQLFDIVGRTAPFVMMGFVNCVVVAGVLLVRFVVERPAEELT